MAVILSQIVNLKLNFHKVFFILFYLFFQWMQKKCLKMLSLTSELLFYTRDCLKISLKN